MAYSLFPRFAGQADFGGGLFRIMDELATISARQPAFAQAPRVFQPRFSLKESETGYELQGELPGVSQKDISIEFTDSQTLSIRGRTESHYEEGSRPGVEAAQAAPAIEEAATEQAVSETASYHKASVEDEGDANTTASTTADATPAETPAQTPAEGSVAATEQQQQPQQQSRYWLSERSVGEFARAFNFPTKVDQENVRASLKDGILSVVVPKAAPYVPKQISIE